MNETVDDLLGEVLAAYLEAVDAGWAPQRETFLARYPALRSELEAFFAAQDQVQTFGATLRSDSPAATDSPKETVAPRSFGDYELLEEIARGGMGIVFKARQVSLNRLVAIKMVLAGDLASASDVQRFRNEAEAAALMDHPNIVPIFDVGELSGWHYFSMKLIEGGSLAQLLGRGEWSLGTKEDCRRAARLIAMIARAVHYAHQRGILHRDLKPGNVLLETDGSPLVTDFGLAKRLDEGQALTQTGAIVGTPSYMAPEQAAGKHRELTTAADVFSLGAILYELLTGRPPFRGENVLDTLLQVREARPVRPWALNPRVDADLETICLKCLEKEPGRRYTSAEALADDLERWQRGEPVRARRTGLLERTWKWARRRPGVALMMALLTGFVLLSTGYATTSANLHEAEQRRAVAEKAEATEKDLRQKAESANHRAEAALYANHVMRAQFEWKENDVARAEQLLNECPRSLRHWEWYYVDRLCHADLRTLHGHTGWIACVCFSPDGNRLASASTDETVRLWGVRTGREERILKGHTGLIWSVCFSPDGKRLASASEDGTVRLWDADTGQETRVLKGHTILIDSKEHIVPVHSVCFRPDGKRLASGGWDQIVRVWDAETGQQVRALKGHTGDVTSVCFSPDGQRLASASDDLTVRLWDADKEQEVRALKGHTNSVTSVCFSPDGQRLASASHDRTVKTWDATAGQNLLSLMGHTHKVLAVCYSRDGRLLASASADRTVRVWNALTGREERTLRGHSAAVDSVCFGENHRLLASASRDRTVKLWDGARSQEALSLTGNPDPVNSLCFSGDGCLLASGTDYRSVTIWNAATGQRIRTWRAHRASVVNVCFSRDGRWLVSAGRDNTVRVWDVGTGQDTLTLNVIASSVCFSGDGRQLASAGEDGTVTLWDVATGQKVMTLQGHTGAVRSVCVSGNGRLLASAASDTTVKLWELATGQEALTLQGHTDSVYGVCFSTDGNLLASASKDRTVKVWDTTTGQEALTLRGHAGAVNSVCFSPDGKRLASASEDWTVKMWDIATGQEVLTLKDHTGEVNGVCFDFDGKHLASAGADGMVKIWDATPLPESSEDKPTP
jgi:WD40 repeat protein